MAKLTNQEKLDQVKQMLEDAQSFADCTLRLDDDACILADYVEKALKVLNSK